MKTLYGVGVGPGDPELVTLKAVRLIRTADYVFVPRSKQDKPGMAEAIVAEYLEGKNIVYLHFPMGPDNSERYKQAAETIDKTLKGGEVGVFITIGDPMVYSTYAYIMFEAQKLGMEQVIVPGITSFNAAASTLGIPVTLKNEKFYLADGSVDEEILQRVQTVCILKPRKEKADTLEKLEKYGFEYAYIKRCSLPQEEILKEKDSIMQDHDYMTVIFARRH